jgi:hypothetical protein
VSLGSAGRRTTFTGMPSWLQYLIAFAVLLVAAPFVAMLARGQGRRLRGGFIMAGILLGFGEVVDPPSKHVIEAQGAEDKASPENDEPK